MEIIKSFELNRDFVILTKNSNGVEGWKKIRFQYDEVNDEWGLVTEDKCFYTFQELEKIYDMMREIDPVARLDAKVKEIQRI